MKPLEVVIAIIRDPSGQFLFQERQKQPYRGYLGLVGGKVELNESRDEALIREIKEETYLEVKKFDYLHLIRETLITPSKNHVVALHLYLVEAGGVLASNPDEGEVRWVESDHVYDKKDSYIPTDWRIVDSFISKKGFFKEILVEDKGEYYEIKSTN